MTLSPILSAPDADTITLDFGVFVAERARTYRTSQNAIIAALLPCITETGITVWTPSQPSSSSSHAPAAQTDGEVVPPASPSATPNSSAVRSTDEQARHEPVDEVVTPPEHVDIVVGNSLPGAERAVDRAPDTDKSVEPSGSAAPSKIDLLKALFADGHQPTNKEAMQALGLKSSGIAANLARRAGVTFRKLSKEEFAARVSGGMQRKAGEHRAKVAETTQNLRTSLPSERLRPPPERDADDVLHKVRRAPTGRFYVRDRVTMQFLHQSLQPSPQGGGPLMTMDRKWAWFDTIERYRGARKRWPQIDEMRKEAAAK